MILDTMEFKRICSKKDVDPKMKCYRCGKYIRKSESKLWTNKRRCRDFAACKIRCDIKEAQKRTEREEFERKRDEQKKRWLK